MDSRAERAREALHGGQEAPGGPGRPAAPKAVERFNAGQLVSFGPLSVGPSGITAGDQSLPWSEIEDVQTRKGMVSVKKSGKWLAWKRAQVSQIPNYFIFDALVGAILAQRPPAPPR